MPIWDRPPRRLLAVLQRLARDRRERGQDDVSLEKVQAVVPGGAVVRNHTVPITGEAVIRAGQSVYVANVDGLPEVILAHSARRSQYAPQPALEDIGIVEQLFIAQDPDTELQDIFFRNFDQITPLGLTGDFAGPLRRVFWGTNTDIFGVLAGSVVHVYQLQRSGKDKIIRDPRVKVKQKLYARDIGQLDLTLTKITFKFKRVTAPPLFRVDVVFDHPNPPTSSFTGVDRLLTETASMARDLTIKLKGTDVVEVVEEVPGTFFGTITISDAGFLINEDNEVLMGLKVEIIGVGVVQSPGSSPIGVHNTTNVVFSALQIGSGAECPPTQVIDQNYVNTATAFPFRTANGGIHPKAVFERNFKPLPNPEFRVYHTITETHAVVANLSSSTVVAGTLLQNPQPEAEDSVEGFRFTQDVFGSIFPGEHAYAAGQAATQSGMELGGPPLPCFSVLADIDNPDNINTLFDAGHTGVGGIIKSDGSLFKTALTMIDIPTKRKMFKRTEVEFEDKKAFDGNLLDSGLPIRPFLARLLGGSSGGFDNGYRFKWRATWARAFADRYQVKTESRPFHTEAGKVWLFVGAVRKASRTTDTGPWFDQTGVSFNPLTDPHEQGAFVLIGDVSGQTVLTLQAFKTVLDPDVIPELFAGNQHHVLWRAGLDWFVTDLDTNTTVQVGFNANDPLVDPVSDPRPGLVVTEPDFLYETQEKQRFFVRGWRGNEITLDQAAENFPPREIFWRAGLLKDLPRRIVPAGEKAVHVVVDTTAFRDLGVPTRDIEAEVP